MSENVIAFGPHFAAAGVRLRYNSKDSTLDVVEAPKKIKEIVNKVIDDISHFENTATYVDGAAAIALADFIDADKNPLSDRVRENVLVGLGIKDHGKFIRQVLVESKNNRSWHISVVPNDCTYFGTECTSRGTVNFNLAGRRSHKKPQDYHPLNGKGLVAREQLVTEALAKMFTSIPTDNLISGVRFHIVDNTIKKLKDLPVEDRLRIIEELGVA